MTRYLIGIDLTQGCGHLYFEDWMKDGPAFVHYSRATEYESLENARAALDIARQHVIPDYTGNLHILRVTTERIDPDCSNVVNSVDTKINYGEVKR